MPPPPLPSVHRRTHSVVYAPRGVLSRNSLGLGPSGAGGTGAALQVCVVGQRAAAAVDPKARCLTTDNVVSINTSRSTPQQRPRDLSSGRSRCQQRSACLLSDSPAGAHQHAIRTMRHSKYSSSRCRVLTGGPFAELPCAQHRTLEGNGNAADKAEVKRACSERGCDVRRCCTPLAAHVAHAAATQSSHPHNIRVSLPAKHAAYRE